MYCFAFQICSKHAVFVSLSTLSYALKNSVWTSTPHVCIRCLDEVLIFEFSSFSACLIFMLTAHVKIARVIFCFAHYRESHSLIMRFICVQLFTFYILAFFFFDDIRIVIIISYRLPFFRWRLLILIIFLNLNYSFLTLIIE